MANDLQARFTNFSKETVLFCKGQRPDPILKPMLVQLVRSATSIGANYAESQSGISRKDFRAKIYISLKEAEETKYWFEVIESTYPELGNGTRNLQIEVEEIVRILQSIANKLKLS